MFFDRSRFSSTIALSKYIKINLLSYLGGDIVFFIFYHHQIL
jgi:hypothetical protein